MTGVERAARDLRNELDALTAKKGKLQDRMAALARDIAQLGETQTHLEAALEVLAEVPANGQPPAKPRPRHGEPRNIDILVKAIGSFGLDPWTVDQVVTASSLPRTAVPPLLTQLINARRIRRTRRGEYETVLAQIAS